MENTHHSLILRLRDRRDAEAWQTFVQIYQPAIYRAAQRCGLQEADAYELVQRVLLIVLRAIDRFEPDPKRAKFRTWLHRICLNEICKQTAAVRRFQGSGDTAVVKLLHNQAADADSATCFTMEYRRSLFRWAASQVEGQVAAATWRAFWLSSVDSVPIAEVAQRLDMSTGAVYIARSRVMKKLQAAVREYEEICEGADL